jgi:hypothetical protein
MLNNPFLDYNFILSERNYLLIFIFIFQLIKNKLHFFFIVNLVIDPNFIYKYLLNNHFHYYIFIFTEL